MVLTVSVHLKKYSYLNNIKSFKFPNYLLEAEIKIKKY